MKRVRDYKYVYENWYKKECRKKNVQPMLLSTFFQTVPLDEVNRLKTHLQNGMPSQSLPEYHTISSEKEFVL